MMLVHALVAQEFAALSFFSTCTFAEVREVTAPPKGGPTSHKGNLIEHEQQTIPVHTLVAQKFCCGSNRSSEGSRCAVVFFPTP